MGQPLGLARLIARGFSGFLPQLSRVSAGTTPKQIRIAALETLTLSMVLPIQK